MIFTGRSALSYRNKNDPGYSNCIANWETFIFLFGIAVAHEIVLLFTGFLTGGQGALTPPSVTYQDYGTWIAGEAGRFWEGYLFGGSIEFFQNIEDPLGPIQAGFPLLKDHRGYMKRISRDYIQRIVNFGRSFPDQ